MKISIMHPTLNGGGGSERVCLDIIEALKEKGFDVFLGTFEKTNWNIVKEHYGEIIKPDQEIVSPRILNRSVYGTMLSFWRLSSKMPKCSDVAIISTFSSSCYWPSIKKLIIYYNLSPDKYQKSIWHLYYKPYVLLQRKILTKISNKTVLTNSSFSAKIFNQVCGVNADILYPPVDIKSFSSSKKENLIVSVGRFHPSKRFEFLIKSFQEVKNGKCIIMGSSTGDMFSESQKYLTKLRKLIECLRLNEKVKVLANCPFDLLTRILSKAKVYVHCSYGEYFGISIVEAMSAGCVPIIHRSGGAYEDIIDYDKYGFSFENVNELSSKINFLLDNDYYEEYSKRAIMRSKYFDKENFKERIVSIVESN